MLSHFPCKYWIRCSTSYQACLAWAYVRPAGLSYSPCLLSHHPSSHSTPRLWGPHECECCTCLCTFEYIYVNARGQLQLSFLRRHHLLFCFGINLIQTNELISYCSKQRRIQTAVTSRKGKKESNPKCELKAIESQWTRKKTQQRGIKPKSG